jgi:sugar lactone lactonase YvrE
LHIACHEQTSNRVPFHNAVLLAENLHPVANPVVDRHGNIYTTISGAQGQRVSVSLYKITPLGEVEPLASGIPNATALALGPEGDLYVSSRYDGVIYRVNERGVVTPFAQGFGTATGLAFDARGRLYVGDRQGTIHQVSAGGVGQVFARLEGSVAGYHLAFGDDAHLYISYPTASGVDTIYRIDPNGQVQPFVSGLGRAQGLAFDVERNLYVVGYTQGEGGIVKITPAGEITQVIAGHNLVGLAFAPERTLIIADNSGLYKLDFGVEGRPLA